MLSQLCMCWPFNPIRAIPLNSYPKASPVTDARVENHPLFNHHISQGGEHSARPAAKYYNKGQPLQHSRWKSTLHLGCILIGLLLLLANSGPRIKRTGVEHIAYMGLCVIPATLTPSSSTPPPPQPLLWGTEGWVEFWCPAVYISWTSQSTHVKLPVVGKVTVIKLFRYVTSYFFK